MAANISELLAEIQDLTAKLEVIGFGGEDDFVVHGGVSRGSIQKSIKDNYSQIQSLVQGRLTFETKSALDSSGAPAMNTGGTFPLADVWNDSNPNLNGIYGYNGTSWLRSDYDVQSTIENTAHNLDNSISFDGTIAFTQNPKSIAITAGKLFCRSGYKGQVSAQSVSVVGEDFYVAYLDSQLALNVVGHNNYVNSFDNVIIARCYINSEVLTVNYSVSRTYTVDDVSYDSAVNSKWLDIVNAHSISIIPANAADCPFEFFTTSEAADCTIGVNSIHVFTAGDITTLQGSVVSFSNTTGHYYLYIDKVSKVVYFEQYIVAINNIRNTTRILLASVYYDKWSQKIYYSPHYSGAPIKFNGIEWLAGSPSTGSISTTLFTENPENNYSVIVDNSIKQLQIDASDYQYFIRDDSQSSGYRSHTGAVNIDFTSDYNYLFYNSESDTYEFKFYADFEQASFDRHLLIGLFYISSSKVWAVLSSGIGWKYNGVSLKSGEVYNPSSTALVYAQIGDSITIKDNKYETDTDYSGNLTGYKDVGYGRILCEKLGISYANHHPQGKNGRTIADYWDLMSNSTITFPSDVSLYSIFLGTNDWGTERHPLGARSDYINDTYSAGNRTSYGALRKIMDSIIGVKNTNSLSHPNIILITPMQRGAFGFHENGVVAEYMKSAIVENVSTGEYEYTVNSYGFTLEDVADMIRWVARREGLPCIDLFDVGIVSKRFLNMDIEWKNEATEDRPLVYQDVLYDNLHPTSHGYELLAVRMLDSFSRVVK